ncbi:aminopeptidase P family protein [Candidatus Peregrinibacteria bacterium]|nr:aminopeptidase P family protein [Candidatus Peregrinibacteria bacterium]
MSNRASSQHGAAQLITNKTNVTYLSNFNGSAGFMLLTKNKKYLFTDFRYIERAKSTIKKGIELVNITRVWRNPKELAASWQKILSKNKIKILGVEESDLTVSRYKKFQKMSKPLKNKKIFKKPPKFVDISDEIEKIRAIKTPTEIKIITESQRINERVFLKIKKIIQKWLKSDQKSALKESYLAWEIKKLAHQFGAEDVSFDPIVGFGSHSARPHHEPDQTKLKKGDIVLIDMGVKYKGYCSDMTRMLFTGKPTAKQVEIYNLVLAAQENAIKKIKAGISGINADKLSRDMIDQAGYKEQYGHAGGHGIGLDIHEIPSLASSYKGPLPENSIVTVEPGIYLEGDFGVRIEDMILVTKTGNRNLTKIPKKLKDITL